MVTEILTCNASEPTGTSKRSQEPTSQKCLQNWSTKLKYSYLGRRWRGKGTRRGFLNTKLAEGDAPGPPEAAEWALLESTRHGWPEKSESSQNQQPQYKNMKKMCTWPCSPLPEIHVITEGIIGLPWTLTNISKGFISDTQPIFIASHRWYP